MAEAISPEEGGKGEAAPPEGEKKAYSCRFCPEVFSDGMELGRHVQKEHQKELKAERTARRAEAPPRGEELWKGEPDATAVLRRILERHPDISKAHRDEVLSWAELRGQLDPQSVAYLLGQMKGISSQTASITAQKYSLALQKAQLEGKPGFQVPILPQLQPQQAPFQFPFGGYQPQQWQPQVPQVPGAPQVTRAPPTMAQPPLQQPYAQPQPYPPYQPYQPRPEKTYKLVVDGQEIETDEKGFMAWKRYLDEQKKPSEKPPSALTKAEVEAIMLETKRELAGAFSETLKQDRGEREKETLAQVVKDIPKQISEAVGRTKSAEERETLADVIKNLPAQITEAVARTKKEEELPKQIAEAVAKAVPKPPPQPLAPPVTKEEIAAMTAKAASEAAASVVEAKAKEDAEQRRHSEILSAIRSGVATQQASGYKEDSYRFLGQGMSAFASALERKEPIKIVLEHAPEILRYTVPPGPKEIAPGATGAEMAGVISKLEPEWVKEK